MTIDENNPLDLFHPLLREWFLAGGRTPTSAQAAAWPSIARGEHVLISSPTGSGKTLAAFLWAINRLVTGEWESGSLRVLYLSPLKALNNDVRENLLLPLAQIRRLFQERDVPMPQIGVMTRSGDTPQSERQRITRKPPEILITTPESLNIMLTTKKQRNLFAGTATVIMDEIHALAGTKRGAHCITAVDRIVPLAGEFQRIALSATVKPLDTVARFIGGWRIDEKSRDFRERQVRIIQSGDEKKYILSVKSPAAAENGEQSRWPAIISTCRREMEGRSSTLIFVNSRRLAEKVSHLINEQEGKTVSYPHHGSLSRELRHAVETRLKKGELRCIVATNSLELGIDVGSLDAVVLVQSPLSVSSTMQRIGRSGHGVGETSRGVLIPLHSRDYIDAAAIAGGVMERDIEPVSPVRSPLDVLAQVILAMTLEEPLSADRLFDLLRCSYPFHELSRKHFNLVLEMLAGRYAGTRVRELNGVLTMDALDGTVMAKKGARYLLYSSGGTIPERGYFALRLQGSMARIGELDEEFVWERAVGDTFSLGSGVWRLQEVTHNDVIVSPAQARPGIIPFWKNEPQDRDFHLSERIALFLERATLSLEDPSFPAELARDCKMDDDAAQEMLSFLRLQRNIAGSIPHRHNLLLEHYRDPAGGGEETQVILHTLWGGRVNRPIAMALAASWKKKHGLRLEFFVNNDSILITLPSGSEPGEMLRLLEPEDLVPSLREVLEETAYFGARFRENAGRALLLPRASLSRRYPLWLNRLRAKKLMDAVKGLADFPLMLETWRTCLQDEFDLENAGLMLEEVASGEITVSRCATAVPSPFAGGIVYRHIEKFMYEDDRPLQSGPSCLDGDLVREVARDASQRPVLDAGTLAALDSLLKRTAPGYSPSSPEDLLDWLVQRVLIPLDEWSKLVSAIERDHDDAGSIIGSLPRKAVTLQPPGASVRSMAALEMIPSLASSLERSTGELHVLSVEGAAAPEPPTIAPRINDRETLLAQWLSFYGPVPAQRIQEIFGITGETMTRVMDSLVEEETIIVGNFSEGSADELCDHENLERLIRMLRRKRRPAHTPLPAERLPLFLASLQGLTRRGGDSGALEDSLERLFGYPCPVQLWEEALFPARINRYQTAWLDSLLHQGGALWFGCGSRRITFAFPGDMELFGSGKTAPAESPLLAFLDTNMSFFDLSARSGHSTDETAGLLWDLVWQGAVRNDAFAVIRKGIAGRFSVPETPASLPGRKGFAQWRATRPTGGSWIALDYGPEPSDEMERDERNRDRVRLLLQRYGVLFRELLDRELPPFRWHALFRTMRLMELSGELTAGLFFEGTSSPQFMSPEGQRLWQDLKETDACYWMNACDPASPCGLGITALSWSLPPRIPSNWLVFCGSRLMMLLQRDGRDLTIAATPEDPSLPSLGEIFHEFVARDFNPLNRVVVESVNGTPAAESPFGPALASWGFRKSYKGFELLRKF